MATHPARVALLEDLIKITGLVDPKPPLGGRRLSLQHVQRRKLCMPASRSAAARLLAPVGRVKGLRHR